MSTRTERFQRKSAPKDDASAKPAEQEEEETVKFSPEEEAVHHPNHNAHSHELTQYAQALLEESNTTKTQANTRFASSEYTEAIDLYNSAISTCPNYLDYEVAVLRSNIAACHLKLEDWRLAVEEATKALDGLDKLQGRGKFEKKKKGEKGGDVRGNDEEGKEVYEEEEADEEIISEGATKAEDTSEKGKRESDIDRIRAKALMRRARARSELGGWSSLAGAEEGKPSLFFFHAIY
jgi:tetratricopeptide (TPR) repeat protein